MVVILDSNTPMPVVKRLTRMQVHVDPSHSVGPRERVPDGILDLMHTTVQNVAAVASPDGLPSGTG